MESIATNKELRAVKDLIVFIAMAIKNYNLYPENHNLFKKLIVDLFQRFKIVLNSSESIKLEIDKDRIFYKEEVVYQETGENENFAFFLFRDGIRCIEFKKALDISEVKYFIRTGFKTYLRQS